MAPHSDNSQEWQNMVQLLVKLPSAAGDYTAGDRE